MTSCGGRGRHLLSLRSAWSMCGAFQDSQGYLEFSQKWNFSSQTWVTCNSSPGDLMPSGLYGHYTPVHKPIHKYNFFFKFQSGMMHAFNPNTWQDRQSSWDWGPTGLQGSQGYKTGKKFQAWWHADESLRSSRPAWSTLILSQVF